VPDEEQRASDEQPKEQPRTSQRNDISSAGESYLEELRREGGPRRDVIADLRKQARARDEELAREQAGEHFLSSDLSHAAGVFETDEGMANAVFAYTQRTRLTAEEFRQALDVVSKRSV
jgi:hypothetical protein